MKKAPKGAFFHFCRILFFDDLADACENCRGEQVESASLNSGFNSADNELDETTCLRPCNYAEYEVVKKREGCKSEKYDHENRKHFRNDLNNFEFRLCGGRLCGLNGLLLIFFF